MQFTYLWPWVISILVQIHACSFYTTIQSKAWYEALEASSSSFAYSSLSAGYASPGLVTGASGLCKQQTLTIPFICCLCWHQIQTCCLQIQPLWQCQVSLQILWARYRVCGVLLPLFTFVLYCGTGIIKWLWVKSTPFLRSAQFSYL